MKEPSTPMNRVFFALLLLAGCGEHLPLVGAPCPCAAGTMCDPGTNLCVEASPGAADASYAPDTPPSHPAPELNSDASAPGLILDTPAPWPNPDVLEPATDAPPGPESPGMGACKSLGIGSASEFEVKFIVPRCGTATCHGPMSVFPPRNLNLLDMIRPNLLDKRGTLGCKNDFYIDTVNPWKSTMLAAVWTVADTYSCPSGGPGGTRMPNKDGMPTIVGTRLTQAELDCFTWWVFEIAKL